MYLEGVLWIYELFFIFRLWQLFLLPFRRVLRFILERHVLGAAHDLSFLDLERAHPIHRRFVFVSIAIFLFIPSRVR